MTEPTDEELLAIYGWPRPLKDGLRAVWDAAQKAAAAEIAEAKHNLEAEEEKSVAWSADYRASDNERAELARQITAVQEWIESLDKDAHWARSPEAREHYTNQSQILRTLLESAPYVTLENETD